MVISQSYEQIKEKGWRHLKLDVELDVELAPLHSDGLTVETFYGLDISLLGLAVPR